MRNGNTDQFFIALTCANGMVTAIGFVTCEYYNHVYEDGTVVEKPRWTRLASKEEVEKVLAQYETQYALSAPEKLPFRGWRFMDDADYAAIQERELRNAIVDNGALVHDMEKARELHKARVLRPARALLFQQLDAEYMKADEAGDKVAKKQIAQRRQELRDVTKHPAIENAATIEELKTAGLDVLNGG